jgi:hypothetical protein
MRARGPRLLGAAAALLLCALAAHASEPRVRHMAPARLEEIRAAFQADVTAGGEHLDSWFGTLCICAPRLWARIRDSIDRYHIELIPAKFAEGSGVVVRGAAGNRDLAEALGPLLGAGVVRAPTDQEVRRYWANFPFDEIDDPVFIVASPEADLLVHLQADPRTGRYSVFIVEAFRP